MAKIYVGAIKIKITVPTKIDLTNATSTTYLIKKPNGGLSIWGASVLGSAVDGVLVYYTAAGDLDTNGTYIGMSLVETSDGGKYYGETFNFKVWKRFE